MTKEELQEKLTEAEYLLSQGREKNERLRKEFAKAFNWQVQRTGSYLGGPDYRISSWEEIFVEIGILISSQKTLKYIEEFEDLKVKILERDVVIDSLTKENHD